MEHTGAPYSQLITCRVRIFNRHRNQIIIDRASDPGLSFSALRRSWRLFTCLVDRLLHAVFRSFAVGAAIFNGYCRLSLQEK